MYIADHVQKRLVKRVEIVNGIKATKGAAMNAIACAKQSMPVNAIASEARDETVTKMIPAMK